MRKTISLLVTLLVLLAVYMLYFSSGKSSLDEEDKAFSIADTASIQKVKFTKVVNGEAEEELSLNRVEVGKWRINEQYDVFQPQINHLLQTLHVIQVKDVLVDQGLETAQQLLDLRHTKVEVIGTEGVIKAYLIGTSTKDYKGTLMRLVDSDLPFIVERPGLQGFINGYFTMEVESWRSRLLFNANKTLIQSFAVQYLTQSDFSFALNKQDNAWKLVNEDAMLAPDKQKLDSYFENFEGGVYAESFAEKRHPGLYKHLSAQDADIEISISYVDGTNKHILLFDRDDNPNSFFGWLEGENELLTIQHFVIDKFLNKKADFLPAQ